MEDKVLDGQVSMFDDEVVDTGIEREEVVTVGFITQNAIINGDGIKVLRKEIEKEIALLDLENVVVTEDTLSEITKVGTSINKRKKEISDTRIAIIKEATKDIKLWEGEVKTLEKFLDDSRNFLLDKVNVVKNELLNERLVKFDGYYDLKKASYEDNLGEIFNLNKHKFEMLELKVIASKTDTHYYKEIDEALEKLNEDLQVIKGNENNVRVFTKWETNGYNLSQALIQVQEDIKQENEVKAKQEALNVDTPSVPEEQPKEVIPDKVETLMTATFNLKGTRENLIKVREYAKSLGVEVL